MTHTVHRIRPADWGRYRELRLQMLQDSPAAFGERYEDALAEPDSEWRSRAEQVNRPDNVALVAVAQDGRWVGMIGGFLRPEKARTAKLVSVWVHPEHRGRDRRDLGRNPGRNPDRSPRRSPRDGAGVAELLLDAALAWARTEVVADRAVLEVHEANGRARAFYARHGFALTGGARPYPLDPQAALAEMELPLAAPPGA